MKKNRRRYTQDNLLYESFYVSLVNSLIVALAPLGIFVFLAAVENYTVQDGFIRSTLRIAQMVFIIAFFINFFYYVYFIRFRRLVSYAMVVLMSCGLGFALFFSDFRDVFDNAHNAAIIVSWFMLLGMILIGNKTGWLGQDDSRYETESWLYKHELTAFDGEDDEKTDLIGQYTHRYIDHRDEDAADLPKPNIDPEQDPKRASRPL